jgi:hypothetical protein
MKKTFLIPALALVAASVALPAAAQSYGYGDRDHRDGRGRYEENHRDGRGGYRDDYRGGRDDYRGWQSINQRQINLDRRIDQGVRNGQLSRREAMRLRAEFNQIARLEARYRRGGLTQWERADLDRRFDRLSAQIRYERHDRDGRRW